MYTFAMAAGAALLIASFAQASEEQHNPEFILKTDQGDIKIKLFADKAPVTVKNFIEYAESGHYNGTIFHRVIEGFMIQGGGFTPDMNQKSTKAPIKNESNNGVSNKRGTLAMARTQAVDSATAQFFINVVDNPFLDTQGSRTGYAVFGEVMEGMNVVDAIRKVPTGSKNGHQDVPLKAVTIKEVVRVKQ